MFEVHRAGKTFKRVKRGRNATARATAQLAATGFRYLSLFFVPKMFCCIFLLKSSVLRRCSDDSGSAKLACLTVERLCGLWHFKGYWTYEQYWQKLMHQNRKHLLLTTRFVGFCGVDILRLGLLSVQYPLFSIDQRKNLLDGRTTVEQLSDLERRSDPVSIELAGVWSSSHALVSRILVSSWVCVFYTGDGKSSSPSHSFQQKWKP